jgi:hypothetical protein
MLVSYEEISNPTLIVDGRFNNPNWIRTMIDKINELERKFSTKIPFYHEQTSTCENLYVSKQDRSKYYEFLI